MGYDYLLTPRRFVQLRLAFLGKPGLIGLTLCISDDFFQGVSRGFKMSFKFNSVVQ